MPPPADSAAQADILDETKVFVEGYTSHLRAVNNALFKPRAHEDSREIDALLAKPFMPFQSMSYLLPRMPPQNIENDDSTGADAPAGQVPPGGVPSAGAELSSSD